MLAIEILISILSVFGANGILLFFIQRYFRKKDAKEEAELAKRELLYHRIEVSLETLRLLSYARMSQEIERLLTKGYATPLERKVLDEMYQNYKDHGWNGDMDSRLGKVYALRTDRAQ